MVSRLLPGWGLLVVSGLLTDGGVLVVTRLLPDGGILVVSRLLPEGWLLVVRGVRLLHVGRPVSLVVLAWWWVLIRQRWFHWRILHVRKVQ